MSLPPGAGDQGRSTGTVQQPCAHNCIEEVGILDGYDEREDDRGRRRRRRRPRHLVQGEVNQFVNLPQEDRFIDHMTRNVDRLGRTVRVRVSHQHRNSVPFQYRLRPAAGNAAYSADEQNGNQSYTYQPRNWVTRRSRRRPTDVEVQLDVAGGNQFYIDVRCTVGQCHRTITCGPVHVWRRIWTVPIRMRNLHVSLPHLHSFREEFRRLNLEFVPFDERIMEDVPAVGSQESFEELHRSAGEAYQVESILRKEPHVIAMIFVDQLGRKRRLSVPVNNIPRVNEHFEDVMDTSGRGPYDLWVDMGPGEQWLDHASFTPQRDWGGKIELNREHFRPAQDVLQADRHTRIRIDGVRVNDHILDELRRRYPGRRLPASAPAGAFDIEVNVMHEMVHGYAITNPNPGVNVILMATRVYWRPKTPEQLIRALKHEMGHRIGMVPDGTAATCDLDSPQATYYQERGHTGPHCSHGIRQNPLPANLANQGANLGADCLMFGDDTGGSSLCPVCATLVKKVDLSQGFMSFARNGFPT